MAREAKTNMKNLRISADVLKKLREKHDVDRQEVEQCFANRTGKLLTDVRAKHRSNPPTLWFLAPTNKGRVLKIVYIQGTPHVDLRSAFEPNQAELGIYAKHG
jgi:hypothetical protein